MFFGFKKSGTAPNLEIRADIESLSSWLAFHQSSLVLHDQAQFRTWGKNIVSRGCIEPLTGQRVEAGVLKNGSAMREGLVYNGVNSRVRAVMLVIAQILNDQQLHNPAIYAAEATTPFALRLRGMYPRFCGSEFTLDPARLQAMYPIPYEDLQALTLKSNAFDIVSTNEVLEHVPSIEKALTELCRVLRPGGWHVGTLPFDYSRQDSTVRARLDDEGNVVHLMEPEYHGDPMSDKGALVFETAGWNVIERALAAGFSQAFMRFIVSHDHGIVDGDIGGVLVFCCRK